MELLNLSLALDPKEARESFRSIDKDFTDQEMTLLKAKVDQVFLSCANGW